MTKPDHMRLLLSKRAHTRIPIGLAISISVGVYPPQAVSECLKILFDGGADIENVLHFVMGKNYDLAIKCIIKFIARMESCGKMPKIDNRNFSECPWALNYYQECEAELKLLRESVLEWPISLYDLLLAEDRSLFTSKSVVDVLKTKDLERKFPNYGKEIHDQCIGIPDEVELWEQGLSGLKRLFGIQSDAQHS